MSNSVFRKYPLPLVISTAMFILPLLTSSVVTAWAISHEDWWTALPLATWVLITIALALASALALIPPGFLALLYGYFLGWIGLPLLVLMNMIAIGVVYGLGKKLISPHLLGYLQDAYPSAAKLLLRFHQDPIRLIFFTKLSPVLPFAITNLLFTLAGARLPQMLLGGTLGMIPRTILSLWVGTQAKEIKYLLEHPNEGLGTKLLIVALVLVSTVGIGWYFKRK